MEGASPPEPLEFLKALHRNGVRYLLIGRRAVIAYGGPVQTMDYDLYIDGEEQNTRQLLSIAERFQLYPSVDPENLTEHVMFRLENSFVVDVLRAVKITNDEGTTLTFDELYERKSVLGEEGELQVNVPSLDDLIELKKMDMDEKDRVDIDYLQRIKKKRDEEQTRDWQ